LWVRAWLRSEPLLDEAQLLDQLRSLGIRVHWRSECGQPGQLATYNMGANQLCLNEGLTAQPIERSKVLHHELVHVVQDCLDGLETSTSMSLVDGLRRAGDLTERQLNGFFLQHLAGARHHQACGGHNSAVTSGQPSARDRGLCPAG